MPLSTSFSCAISVSREDILDSMSEGGVEIASEKVNVRMEGKPPASMLLMYMMSDSASKRATVEPGDNG